MRTSTGLLVWSLWWGCELPGKEDPADSESEGVPLGEDSDEPDTAACEPSTWYQDWDGDGYGSSWPGPSACEQPDGYVADASDCDDGDASVYPGADEVCGDDLDNDCDGHADEDDAVDVAVWYRDADEDGYGDPSVTKIDCDQPYDSVAEGTDCDDEDATVHPGAEEVCGDGVDNDCGGGEADPETECGAAVDLSEVALKLLGEEEGDHAGGSVAGPGDVDGDGWPDLLLGALGQDSGGDGAGGAYVVLGSAELAGAGTLDLSEVDLKLVGEESDDQAGGVAGAGDVDGDGRADLLVGAPENDSEGRYTGAVYLVLGKEELAGVGTLDLSEAELKVVGEAFDHLSTSNGAGDVDDDGRADLLVGARYNDDGGWASGAAYLVLGSEELAGTGTMNLPDADLELVGEETEDQAGSCVAGAGDVDGDGWADMLIGAWEQNGAGPAAGAAYLVMGSSDPAGDGTLDLSDADLKLIGEESYDRAGSSVAGVGDLDDDGRSDLVVAAAYQDSGGEDAGAGYLVMGSADLADSGSMPLSRADLKLVGQEESDFAGAGAETGDLDGDGSADLIVSAAYGYGSGESLGAVYLLLGAAELATGGTLDLSEADLKLLGEEDGDVARFVAGVGDLDVDGRADLLVGAPGQDSADTDAGAAYLVLGGSL